MHEVSLIVQAVLAISEKILYSFPNRFTTDSHTLLLPQRGHRPMNTPCALYGRVIAGAGYVATRKRLAKAEND
jgi:hypothetical protein